MSAVSSSDTRFLKRRICIRAATLVLLRSTWESQWLSIWLFVLTWKRLSSQFSIIPNFLWHIVLRSSWAAGRKNFGMVQKSTWAKNSFLLLSKFSSFSTQQKWTVEKRNKTNKISSSFCTKKRLNPFSSLGERVVWSCLDGFKKAPKTKTHTSCMHWQ